MKVLHTADWHLGVTTNGISRTEDHERFFDWLLAFIDDQEVDVLVVAGDVFDTNHPPAGAQQQYYRFLAKCAARSSLQLVIVGGNHDSPSRLNAPSELLQALNIRVIGGLWQDSLERGDHVIPLRNRSGQVAGVLLAVPYVAEWKVRNLAGEEGGMGSAEFAVTEGFSKLYARLSDQAEAKYPGVPILATGHLTVQACDTDQGDDFERHRIGTIESLSPSIFDPRIQYVALGHIHQCYPVDRERRGWYSGSPIPIGVRDGASARQVLLLEVEPTSGSVTVERHKIPDSRPLIKIGGALDEVVAQIRTLSHTGPLTPLLYLEVHAVEVPTGYEKAIEQAIAAHPPASRPTLVEERVTLITNGSAPPSSSELGLRRVDGNLDPLKVFQAFVTAQGYPNDPDLDDAFIRLLDMNDDDLADNLRLISEAHP